MAMTPHDLTMRNSSVSYPVLKEQKANELIKSYATKQSEAFIAKLKAGDFDTRNRLLLDYAVIFQDARLVTIRFSQQEQFSDRPTMVSHRYMTIDLLQQKEIALKDLFKPEMNSQEWLGVLLYDYFKQGHAAAFTPGQLFALFQFKPEAVSDFWVSDGAIGFSFNPWQLDAKENLKTITIDKTVLADVLKPEYATLISTDTSGEIMPDFTIAERPTPGDTIDPNQKMLALTFDDGPGRYTSRVLDVLNRYRTHGTFFVLGQQVAGRADIVKRMADEGHEIGNHSWDHALLPPLAYKRLQHEIADTQNAIRAATGGYTPVLMRPPYGASSPAVIASLGAQGLKLALWNVDTEDWLHKGNADAVYAAVMGSAGDGKIILLHDIHEGSVEAIERAIPELVKQGFQLVTMSQLERYR